MKPGRSENQSCMNNTTKQPKAKKTMKTIKQLTIAHTLLTMLVVGGLVGTDAMSNKANAAEHQRASDVVVLIARGEVGITPRQLHVIVASSSQGAPTVSENTELAQALADLLSQGFTIQSIEYIGIGINYTLVREARSGAPR